VLWSRRRGGRGLIAGVVSFGKDKWLAGTMRFWNCVHREYRVF